MTQDPKSIEEGLRHMALLWDLGPHNAQNTTQHAVIARLYFNLREITERISPVEGFLPTGFLSEADHQAAHAAYGYAYKQKEADARERRRLEKNQRVIAMKQRPRQPKSLKRSKRK